MMSDFNWEDVRLHLTLHWDLEWRQTRLASVRRYCRILSSVLDRLERPGSAVSRFSMDGQAALLEAVREFDSALFERLLLHVKAGRVAAGPAYVHTEPGLLDGESLIANLRHGIRDFPTNSQTAYFPDTGGLPRQLPQILRGLGLNGVVSWRGVASGPNPPAFDWVGPDGTRIPVLEMTDGIGDYTASESFGPDGTPSGTLLKRLGEASARWTGSPTPWICATFDDLAGLDSFLARNPVRQASVDELVDEISRYPLPERFGELRDYSETIIMNGSASARIDEKIRARSLENRLLRESQPLASMAGALTRNDLRTSLEAAWRDLLRNQAEDVLRGCGIDGIYQGATDRFTRTSDLLNEIADECLLVLSRHVAASDGLNVLIVNPGALPVNGVALVTVDFAPGSSANGHFRTASGDVLPSQVVRQESLQRIRYGDDLSPAEVEFVDRFLCAVDLTNVPLAGLSGVAAAFVPEAQGSESTLRRKWYGTYQLPQLVAKRLDPMIDNGLVNVSVDGNALVLLDKTTGTAWGGMNVLGDEPDEGDLYNAAPPPGGALRLGTIRDVAVTSSGPLYHEMRVTWVIPELTKNTDRLGSDAVRSDVQVEAIIGLRHGSETLDVECRVSNYAAGHKLTAWFRGPSGIEAVAVTQPFDVVERSVDEHYARGRYETGTGAGPHGGAAVLRNGEASLMLQSVDLPAYEVRRSGDAVWLGLTLLRSVGRLNRDENSSRPYRAGPNFNTPAAQLLDTAITSRYSFSMREGAITDEDVMRELSAHRERPIAFSFRSDGQSGADALPRLLRVEPDFVQVTTLARDGDAAIFRLWNPTKMELRAEVECDYPVRGATLMDLLGRPADTRLERDAETFRFKLPPRGVTTLRLDLATIDGK